MKTKDDLKIQVESFSELKENWGSYNEDTIIVQSIMTAHKIIDCLPSFLDLDTVDVFPMRDGGIQIDIGEFKEIEIFNYNVVELNFDSSGNIKNKYCYTL
jgi:hypothetical protein